MHGTCEYDRMALPRLHYIIWQSWRNFAYVTKVPSQSIMSQWKESLPWPGWLNPLKRNNRKRDSLPLALKKFPSMLWIIYGEGGQSLSASRNWVLPTSWMSLEGDPSSRWESSLTNTLIELFQPCLDFRPLRNCELTHVCCFKPLSLW